MYMYSAQYEEIKKTFDFIVIFLTSGACYYLDFTIVIYIYSHSAAFSKPRDASVPFLPACCFLTAILTGGDVY